MPIKDPIFIFFFIILVITVYSLKKKSREKRKKGMQEIADELNFNFSPGSDESIFNKIKSIEYLENIRDAFDILNGDFGGITTTIAHCYTGSRKHRHEFFVYQFSSPEFVFPQFNIEPEGFLDRFRKQQDINFDTHPEFSKKHIVQGEDEDKIRETFSADFLTAFEKMEHSQFVQCNGDELIFYDWTTNNDIDNIPVNLEKYVELITLLKSQ